MSLSISQAQSKYALNKCGHLENEVQNGNVYCPEEKHIVHSSKVQVLCKRQCSLLVEWLRNWSSRDVDFGYN